MRRIILLTAILISIADFSFGQMFCGTPVPTVDPLRHVNSNTARTASFNCYTVNVYFHLVNRTNGTGGQNASVINTVMTNLANAYNAQGIWFNKTGNDVINNDAYYAAGFTNGPSALFNQLIATNVQANSLNIYLLGDAAPFVGGSAGSVPSSSCVIGGSYSAANGFPNAGSSVQPFVPSFVVAHEVGHCMGLLHTFETSLGAELVNGSNCTTAGDLVCDTPAESPSYAFQDNSSCQWVVSYSDGNGQTYTPDAANIMNYVRPSCMNYVTNGQGTRVRTTIGSSAVLSPVATLGVPQLPTLTLNFNPTPICVNQSLNGIASPTTGLRFGYATITWTANTPTYLAVDGNGNGVQITGVKKTATGSYATFSANASFALCGTSSTTTWGSIVTPACGGGGTTRVSISAFPNPATNQLTIASTSSLDSETSDFGSMPDLASVVSTSNFSARLINMVGSVVAEGECNNGLLIIDTSHLTKGIYYLRVKTDDTAIERRISIVK